MIIKIFAVFDTKAQAFNSPFFMMNEGMAIRGFSDAVNNKENAIGQHPEDYTLFRIGDYNDENGAITPEAPTTLGIGVEYISQPNYSEKDKS